MKRLREKRISEILFIGFIFLLFLQLLAEFVATVHARSFLLGGFNGNLWALLFLLSPLLLSPFGSRVHPLLIIIFGELALIFRILSLSAEATYKILLSGFGLSLFLLFFPAYLHFIKDSNRNTKGASLGIGLGLSLLLLIFFKTVNSSVDLSTYGDFSWLTWVISGLAFLLMPVVLLGGEDTSKSRNRQIFGKKSERPSIFLPAWGMFSVILMVHFIFASPVVLTRWAEGSYEMIIAFQILVIAAYLIDNLLKVKSTAVLSLPILILWNLLFVLFLHLLILNIQVSFPTLPTDYPVFKEPSGNWNQIFLYGLLLLSPVLLVDLSIFSAQIIKTTVSISRVAFGFFMAQIIFLLLILFNLFTAGYENIPVVGSLFRDQYWLLYLLVGLGLVVPVIVSRPELIGDRAIRFSRRDRFFLGLGTCGLVILILLTIPRGEAPVANTASHSKIRVMTYNINQGYNPEGVKRYDQQLAFIKSVDPDILALQETDAMRIAGGNTDLVRYYADQLNMFVYNGPNPVTDTFGVALLTKKPWLSSQTFFMFSKKEHLATIVIELPLQEDLLNIYATDLGREGDLLQIKAIMDQLQTKTNVVLLGDFNFTPDSNQYQFTTASLVDGWKAVLPAGKEKEANNPAENQYERVDYIFLSPPFKVTDSQLLFNPYSDHPAVTVDLELPTP